MTCYTSGACPPSPTQRAQAEAWRKAYAAEHPQRRTLADGRKVLPRIRYLRDITLALLALNGEWTVPDMAEQLGIVRRRLDEAIRVNRDWFECVRFEPHGNSRRKVWRAVVGVEDDHRTA